MSENSTLAGCLFLVVEDDRLVASQLRRFLEHHRGTCLEARGLEDARALLDTPPAPDVALLDLEIAGGFGLSLAPTLHRLRTAFIVQTAYGDSHREACLDHGAWDVLDKPCEPDDLLDALRGAVARTRYLRSRFPEAGGGPSGGPSGLPRQSDDSPATFDAERSVLLIRSFMLRLRQAAERADNDSPSRPAQVALLLLLGLTPKSVSRVTGTSLSNVNRCVSVLRDRVGWRSPRDGLRWWIATIGADISGLLCHSLVDKEMTARALDELGISAAPRLQ